MKNSQLHKEVVGHFFKRWYQNKLDDIKDVSQYSLKPGNKTN
jgi:hypothetical protein